MTPDERDTQIRVRITQDILLLGTAAYWRRRAETFEDARPRPGDFNGQATAGDIRDRDARLATLAEQCRHHAEVIEAELGQVAA